MKFIHAACTIVGRQNMKYFFQKHRPLLVGAMLLIHLASEVQTRSQTQHSGVPDLRAATIREHGLESGKKRIVMSCAESKIRAVVLALFRAALKSSTPLNTGAARVYLCIPHTVIRAIGESHTACKDDLRQNLRSPSCSVFFFFSL